MSTSTFNQSFDRLSDLIRYEGETTFEQLGFNKLRDDIRAVAEKCHTKLWQYASNFDVEELEQETLVAKTMYAPMSQMVTGGETEIVKRDVENWIDDVVMTFNYSPGQDQNVAIAKTILKFRKIFQKVQAECESAETAESEDEPPTKRFCAGNYWFVVALALYNPYGDANASNEEDGQRGKILLLVGKAGSTESESHFVSEQLYHIFLE